MKDVKALWPFGFLTSSLTLTMISRLGSSKLNNHTIGHMFNNKITVCFSIRFSILQVDDVYDVYCSSPGDSKEMQFIWRHRAGPTVLHWEQTHGHRVEHDSLRRRRGARAAVHETDRPNLQTPAGHISAGVLSQTKVTTYFSEKKKKQKNIIFQILFISQALSSLAAATALTRSLSPGSPSIERPESFSPVRFVCFNVRKPLRDRFRPSQGSSGPSRSFTRYLASQRNSSFDLRRLRKHGHNCSISTS